MDKPILTIAIPTYNRAGPLEHTLRVILPQMENEPQVCLLIIDNHSELPASRVLESLDHTVSPDRIRSVRNAVNIGGNANIMRCFELCETKWLWVLGDDDAPSHDAVSTILNDDCVDHCFAFYTVPEVGKPIFVRDEESIICGNDFRELISYFGSSPLEISFLSAAIFNMERIRPHIIDGYLSANTGLPHLMMVFKALVKGYQWMLSKKVIADYCPPEAGSGWGFMTFAYTTSSLLGLTSSCSEVNVIRDIMIKGWRPSPKKILYSLVSKYTDSSSSTIELRYLFKTIQSLYMPTWSRDPMLRIRWKITSIWAYFPRVFAMRYKKKKEGRARINLNNEERR